MSFVFTTTPEFTADVAVKWPVGEDWQTMTFKGRFRLDPDVDFAAPTEAEDYDGAHEEMIERIATVLIGWEGIETPDGSPLPFADETLRDLMRHLPIRMAVVAAYVTAISTGGMRLGNSERPPAPSGAAGQKTKKTRKAGRH
jgi:hypothetical protein